MTAVPIGYLIRPAQAADASLLPDIERSAGELFRTLSDLAWIADDSVQSEAQHLAFIALGSAWVAVDVDDRPVAFLNGERMGPCFHIWEMAVHETHQRQGLGARLIEKARRHAMAARCTALTLTTFRGVAWNDGFYARLGFAVVDNAIMSDALCQILADEAEAGLPPERRCAMIMRLFA